MTALEGIMASTLCSSFYNSMAMMMAPPRPQGFKAALIKESIRMGHQDLGDWAYERGDLQVGGR